MTFFNIFSNKENISKNQTEKIIIDNRERNSLIPSHLKKLGFQIEFKQLPVADYLIGDTAIERKTISDFKSSIINKRIMQQLIEIKQYSNPILILEGLESEDPYSGGINENAFRGFILSIIKEYKVPIIFTLNEKDTAKYIQVLSKISKPSKQGIRASKIHFTEKEQVQFILEGFPNIGPSTISKLLKKFKTISNIINAKEEELKECIGKKADSIINLRNFKPSS